MNIQYILIALTCLMLSIDSAAMRGRGGGGLRGGAGHALQVRPITKPAFKPDHKPGYNPWHRPNYWRRPVYAPTYIGVGYPDYYPDYYATDSGYTSGEQLGINPQDQQYYPNTTWSGY